MNSNQKNFQQFSMFTIYIFLLFQKWQTSRHAAVDRLKLLQKFLSLFSEATNKDRGKFLGLNLPNFHAVIMIFCPNLCIKRWIGCEILFDSDQVYSYNTPLRCVCRPCFSRRSRVKYGQYAPIGCEVTVLFNDWNESYEAAA